MSTSRIIQLAQLIASNTQTLDEHLTESGLPQPSFQVGAPTDAFPQSSADVADAKTKVIEATIELRQLLEGPVKSLLPESNSAPLASVYRFNIAPHVPLNGTISFADLAQKCGLLEHDLRRIIRYTAIHHRVFAEPEEGLVSHTAASRLLAENEMIGDLMGLTFAECWPAHARAPDAITQRSEEPNISGYSLANDTTLNMFEYLGQHPDRARRFAGAMSSTSQASLDALATYFDWAGLPPGATVVDVGGAQGHVSVHLARRFPNLNFIVRDLPEVIEGAQDKIPEDIQGSVRLEGHDMFTPQPKEYADVYLLRYVLHDWPDKYCIRVLENIVPVLKEGAKVVLQEHVLPEHGTLGLLQEMQVRSMDAIMMSLFNSRERGVADWESIFAQAGDGRFSVEVKKVKENPSTGVIIAEWRGYPDHG
ncbi:putative O-methyltransferase [Bimuria novae-zelandiae CBS 107.79]|uniref:Putative O-methyltransferase n=1 Tax=Bimuria novae-zelandiae CBS 107.79 TaxID=1447943 RepID=A0A6A5VU81_9PLEO|nr:putative O-methyltransferase [Bimuria novae-zelandiae CBS 107.79]